MSLPHAGNFIYESDGLYIRIVTNQQVQTFRFCSNSDAVDIAQKDWYLQDGGTILMSIKEFKKCIKEVFYNSNGDLK